MEEYAMKKKILVVLTMCGVLFCGSMNTFAAGGRNYVDQNNDGICDFYGISECMGKFCGGLRQSGLRVGSAAQNIKNLRYANVAQDVQNVENGNSVQNVETDNVTYVTEEVFNQCPVCGTMHEGVCIYGDGACVNPAYDGSCDQYYGNGNGAGTGYCNGTGMGYGNGAGIGNGGGAGMGHHGRHGR